MSKRKNAILIFSKSADRSAVKTRLRPYLTEEQCVTLHLALLKDTLTKCKKVKADLMLYQAGNAALPFSPGIPVVQQTGSDLGTRMANAFTNALEIYEKVAITGIDSPVFPPARFSEAFDGLETHEIVLGPAEDGGYYLIALKQQIHEIFTGIPWGTAEVLQKTLSRLNNRKVLLLETCFDIDLSTDLMRLEENLKTNDAEYLSHIRHWFRQFKR